MYLQFNILTLTKRFLFKANISGGSVSDRKDDNKRSPKSPSGDSSSRSSPLHNVARGGRPENCQS